MRMLSTPAPGKGTPSLSLGKKLLFASIIVSLFFVLLECGLRVVGLGQPPVLGRLRFGYDAGIPRYDSEGIEFEGVVAADVPLFQEDQGLFWKPIAHTPFTGEDGLRLPVPQRQAKTDGVFRIAVLGDSCSFLGHELYPARFGKLLQAHRGGKVDVVNASCPGYTSFQGVRRAEDIWAWRPDLLLVYFGWNDHWNALSGHADAELAALEAARQFVWLDAQCKRLHIFWLLRGLTQGETGNMGPQSRTVRVQPADYRANLEKIARQAELHQCRVMFLTAPTAFRDGNLPAWAAMFFGDVYAMSVPEVDAIPRIHEEYNHIVRLVAAERKALLGDLAKAWPAEKTPGRFRSDRIHLTETGHQDVAEVLWQVWKD